MLRVNFSNNTRLDRILLHLSQLIIPSFFAGQFFCGNKYCDEKDNLKSWEVNFGYMEHGEKRNALVKLSKLTLDDSFLQRLSNNSDFKMYGLI